VVVGRDVEQFALEVVRRVLHVDVEEYDIGPRQAAVDALIHYPDGRSGAIEVSSVGPQSEAQITNALAGRARRHVPGLRRAWTAQVPRDFHPAGLSQLDAAVLRCETEQVDRFDDATDELTTGPDEAAVSGRCPQSVPHGWATSRPCRSRRAAGPRLPPSTRPLPVGARARLGRRR
jgi:hypothetical protein